MASISVMLLLKSHMNRTVLKHIMCQFYLKNVARSLIITQGSIMKHDDAMKCDMKICFSFV